MLINYIKVFQQSEMELWENQAINTDNTTGVGGPIPGDSNGVARPLEGEAVRLGFSSGLIGLCLILTVGGSLFLKI